MAQDLRLSATRKTEMSSKFHLQNEKIRKAIARRAREKGIQAEDDEASLCYGDIGPSDPGDGHIVRKRIRDEGEDDE